MKRYLNAKQCAGRWNLSCCTCSDGSFETTIFRKIGNRFHYAENNFKGTFSNELEREELYSKYREMILKYGYLEEYYSRENGVKCFIETKANKRIRKFLASFPLEKRFEKFLAMVDNKKWLENDFVKEKVMVYLGKL